jgi:energy-coupling factor transport system ATP-binding protein
MERNEVEFHGVTFHYQKNGDSAVPALDIGKLSFEEERCYLITGLCGSGKTTLAMLLKGLVQPTSGKITVHGCGKTLSEFQHSMGFAFQYPEEQFFKETVSEEISFGPTMLGHEGIEKSIGDSLQEVGLSVSNFAQRSPFELSSGEKRRLAIASIIACDPSWYIFDEPTAGLDPEGKQLLRALIKRLADKGKTVLIITQELALFAPLSDEIILLDEGRLIVQMESRAYFEHRGIALMEKWFPYHIRALRALRDMGWDLPVSILDPSEAATRISALL